MNSNKKQGNSCSESSSDEQSEATKEDDSYHYSESFTNIKQRSYECIFCKRGFTNAQALGGHMNIHRKHRPNKAPKTSTSFSSSSNSLQSNHIFGQSTFNNIPYFGYQPSTTSNPHGYFHELGNFNINLWGSDLSLQIGPTTTTTRRRRLWNDDGLDLELRLGHHDP